MTELELLKSFDGRVWAEEFVRIAKEDPAIAQDVETMTTWFCNALMRGYDEYRNTCLTT